MGARFFQGGGGGPGVSHFRGEGVKLADPIFNGQFFSKKKIQYIFFKIKKFKKLCFFEQN
jgi:hypothetical protein